MADSVARVLALTALEAAQQGGGGGGSSASITYGYYLNGNFYKDSTYTEECDKDKKTIYVNKNSAGGFYTWDGDQFNCSNPVASQTVAGITKVYKDGGTSTDGTMDQKTITQGVQSIGFSVDSEDADCLIVDLPW